MSRLSTACWPDLKELIRGRDKSKHRDITFRTLLTFTGLSRTVGEIKENILEIMRCGRVDRLSGYVMRLLSYINEFCIH